MTSAVAPDAPSPESARSADPDTTGPVLAGVGLTKVFGRTTVLDHVDFAVDRGQVHAIVGENGAGKTTLLRILAGREQPTEGHLIVGGRQQASLTPAEARSHGINVVPQHVELVEDLSVADNIFLGRWPTRTGVVDRATMRTEAARVLGRVGVDLDPSVLVRELSYLHKQMVEIARISEFDPSVIILDEPTAALSVREIRILFGLIRQLRRQGIGVVYVSHYLNEIARISDQVTVLREGRVVRTSGVSETSPDQLVTDMVGRIGDLYPTRSTTRGEPLLALKSASTATLQDVSFTIHAGEVVGLAAPKGEGISDLLRAMCRVSGRLKAGTLELRGQEIRPASSAAVLRAGIGYLSEERTRWGLIRGRSVRENITASSLGDYASPVGTIDIGRERKSVSAMIREFVIRTPSPEADIRVLSGGNQQKALLARLFRAGLSVYMLDDPTFGVDVGSKSEINRLLNQEVERGAGFLLHTSDLSELLYMSDRILFIKNGRVVQESLPQDLTLARVEHLLEADAEDAR